MTKSKKWILLGLAIAMLAVAMFYAGTRCNSSRPLPVVGIDAGPGEAEIQERLDRLEQQSREEIERIERQYLAELKQFDEAQQREYAEVRERGPAAVAEWLTAFNRSLKFRDGGV